MNGWVSSIEAYVRPQLGSLWSSATIYFSLEIEIRRQLTPSGGLIGGLLESPPSKTKISFSTSWSVRSFFWIWAVGSASRTSSSRAYYNNDVLFWCRGLQISYRGGLCSTGGGLGGLGKNMNPGWNANGRFFLLGVNLLNMTVAAMYIHHLGINLINGDSEHSRSWWQISPLDQNIRTQNQYCSFHLLALLPHEN